MINNNNKVKVCVCGKRRDIFCTFVRDIIYLPLKFKLAAVKTNLYDNPTNYHTPLKKLK